MMPAGPPPAITQRVCSFSAMRFQSNTAQIRMKANMPENAQNALRLPTTRRQISTTPRHSAFGTISDVERSNWLHSRLVRESSMFVAGLELLLCQLRRQSARGNVIGVDLAKQLLELARTKAIQRRLRTSNSKSAICSQ